MDTTQTNTNCDVAKIGIVDFAKEHVVEIAVIAISTGLIGFYAGNRSSKKKGLGDVSKPEWSDDIKKRIRQKEDGNNDKYYELSRLLNRLEAVIPRNKWDDYLRAVRKNNR
ncbi:MAG: hypothetical protein LBO69_06170, partial [Ignavibacteria bacterium]|nr:hypothetical protein [Ignavibacteria bacterium]